MEKTNTFTLTYAEGFLLSTQTISAYTLHQQYSILTEQNTIIKNLSSDLGKLKDELAEVKLTSTQAALQVSSKVEGAVSTLSSPYFANPKIILGFIGTGVLYFYVIPALGAKLALPTLKTFLIPIKSAVVGLIPFIKEEKLIEFIKEGCTYRLKLIGDQVSCLEARQADSESFKPVSDLINQPNNLADSATQTANPPSPSPLQTVSKTATTEPTVISFTETAADSAATPSVEAVATPSVEAVASVTEQTLTMLSALG